jgi:hypothetical protein
MHINEACLSTINLPSFLGASGEKKPLAPKNKISTTRAKPGGNSFSFKIQIPPGPTLKGTYLVFNQTISVPPGPAQEGTYLVFYHISLYYRKNLYCFAQIEHTAEEAKERKLSNHNFSIK